MNVYTNEKIEVDGLSATFDGVGDNYTLRVFRYTGDEKALQQFCFTNGYTTLIIK